MKKRAAGILAIGIFVAHGGLLMHANPTGGPIHGDWSAIGEESTVNCVNLPAF